MRTACCILSHNITKGMKSFGPIGLLKKNNQSKELILKQIEYLRDIYQSPDIYIVTGFGQERLKKILPNKKYIHFIHNDKYVSNNYAYALKLFLNHINNKIDDYSGVFFIDNNVLIRRLINKKKNESWLVTYNHKNNKYLDKDFLGINFNKEHMTYLFYNIGNISWYKSFYLTISDVKLMIEHQDEYYDNMFLFEVLNKFVEKFNMRISMNNLLSIKDVTEIKGLKDKSKIK